MKTFQQIIETAPHIIKRKLEQLKFLRERPDFHPEPSAFAHIQIVTERLMQTGNPNLIMCGVLHDICKFDTVRMNEKTGWPTSPGHDSAALTLVMENNQVRAFCVEHGADPDIVAQLCGAHMRFHQLGQMRPAKSAAQIDTWKTMGIWEMLQIMGAADNMLEDFDLSNLEKSWKFNRTDE
jgi:hypothetical protein